MWREVPDPAARPDDPWHHDAMTVYGGDTIGGPSGFTYSGVLARAERDAVLSTLGEARFSGWVGPQEGDWVVAVPTRTHGAVAGSKMRLADVARALAAASRGPAVAVLVDDDKVLWLWAFDGDTDLGSYLSAPSVAFPHDDEAGIEPEGSAIGSALAAAVDRPDAGEDLEEILAEELTDSVNESERLTAVCRLLDLPEWLVASASLPRNVAGGPRAKDFTKLGAGREGVKGSVDAAVRGIVRKKK